MFPHSRLLTIIALGGGLALVPSISAVVALGHGRFIGAVSARADYDSNIFVSNTEIDDVVGTFDGSMRYIRDESVVTFEAVAGATVFGFAEHEELNSFDPYLEGNVGYVPSEKTELRGSVGYRRSTIANEIVNDRTQSNDFTLDGLAQHLFSEKLGYRATGRYVSNNYHTAGYSDVLSYSLGLDVVHIYSPKLKLLAGLTTIESWTDNRAAGRGNPSNQDWRYTVGAEGELAAKVMGDISVGYVQREFESAGFDDTGSLYLSSRITWQAAEKTAWTLLGTRDLSLSAADQSVASTNFSVNVAHALSEKLSFDGGVGYFYADFAAFNGLGDRRDKGFTLRGRLNFAINDRVSMDVAAGYRDSDSNIAVSNYDRLNIGAGVAVRF